MDVFCSLQIVSKKVNARGTISVFQHLEYRRYRHLFANAQSLLVQKNSKKDWIKSQTIQTAQTRVKRYRTTQSNRVQQVDSFRQTLSRHYNNHSVRIEIILLVRHRARSSKSNCWSKMARTIWKKGVYIFFLWSRFLVLDYDCHCLHFCRFFIRSHFNGYLIVYYIYNRWK